MILEISMPFGGWGYGALIIIAVIGIYLSARSRLASSNE